MKRLIGCLMSLVLVVGLLPAAAWGAGANSAVEGSSDAGLSGLLADVSGESLTAIDSDANGDAHSHTRGISAASLLPAENPTPDAVDVSVGQWRRILENHPDAGNLSLLNVVAESQAGSCNEKIDGVAHAQHVRLLKTHENCQHQWGAWEVVREPTADAEGLERRVCSLDPDHVVERAIPKIEGGSGEGPGGDEGDGSGGDSGDGEGSGSGENPGGATASDLYYVTAGGSSWSHGSDAGLSFTFKRHSSDEQAFDHFKGVCVDGLELDREFYDAE